MSSGFRNFLSRRAPGVRGAALIAVTIPMLMTGCSFLDDLVGVDVPDRVVGETLEVPVNAPVMMAGAVGDFECALAMYVLATGTTADELMVTDGLTAQELYDRRTFDPRGLGSAYSQSTCSARYEGTVGVYRPLSSARFQAENLVKLLEGWSDADVPNRKTLIAKAAAYAGYSYLLLGESMCEAAFDLGPRVGSPVMFASAEAMFTKAIANATEPGSAEFLNMALMGRARTRLNLGNRAAAAADARLVPSGFVKNANYSTVASRRENFVHVDGLGNLFSVDPQFRNFQHMGVADPRVGATNTGRVVAGVNIPVWTQTKYPARNSSIPIARYAEAQLIIAEAEADAGNLQAAVNIINALHSRVGIPPFASNDKATILAHIIVERSAELFLEGQRFGDIRRYNLPLIPAPGTQYHAGGTYSDARCYPFPGIESDGNPNA
jgi:hypothetical protein